MIKTMIKIAIVIIIAIIVILIGYAIYLTATDYRPKEEVKLNVENNKSNLVKTNEEMIFVTANVGFGAYDDKFDFFMDGGKRSRAINKENVEKNIQGSIDSIKEYNPDFIFVQEVDNNSTRSYKVDEYNIFKDGFNEYSSSYAINFKNPWIAYPFLEPHGKVNAGQVTLAKANVKDATRRALPINESWPQRLVALDRCALISRVPVENGKELVLINVHLSAYDKGGVIRKKQLELLQDILLQEKDNGNYVVMGGDFNHQIPGSHPENFKAEEQWPDWLQHMPDEFKPDGFRWIFDDNIPTCRTAGEAYKEGYNFLCIIDGFMVSDNIEIVKAKGIDNNFKYSDHNPLSVTMKLR